MARVDRTQWRRYGRCMAFASPSASKKKDVYSSIVNVLYLFDTEIYFISVPNSMVSSISVWLGKKKKNEKDKKDKKVENRSD